MPFKLIILFGFLLTTESVYSQTKESQKIDFHTICSDKPLDQSLIVIDNGFCAHFLESENKTIPKESLPLPNHNCIECEKNKENKTPTIKFSDKWKIRLYTSHSFTTYFNTDVSFNSSRYNVEVKNYEWAERGSREFFNPKTWSKEGCNPAQIIDEPTNTFVVSIEKDGNEFFLSAFHPKFTQGENKNKYMKGTIDGVAVDGYQNVNNPFHGYVQVPGESKLVRNENTYREMIFEGGYGHRFKLIDTKIGSLTYVPSVSAGLVVGNNFSNMVEKGEWWEYDDHREKYGIQGFGGSVKNRIEFNSPKEKFGLFYENKLGMYKMEHGFMDGSEKYNLKLMGNSVGMKFMIYNPNNHKKTIPAGTP